MDVSGALKLKFLSLLSLLKKRRKECGSSCILAGVVSVEGVILLILGSIPNSAEPMVVWFFLFSGSAVSRGLFRRTVIVNCKLNKNA